jgi:hypothetical protein
MTAQDRNRVRTQVVAFRRARGLSETVTDERILDQLAAEVLGGGQGE